MHALGKKIGVLERRIADKVDCDSFDRELNFLKFKIMIH
jgi:hypothetical protein